jgi:hypothetical protein
MPAIPKKVFNSALDGLLLSQLPPSRHRRIARSSQEIQGKSAAEELQTHRTPFGTEDSVFSKASIPAATDDNELFTIRPVNLTN